MGIRFWCPNGHKLNVKSFQAGRRGICPYCGARFQIPAQSTRKPGAQDRAPEPEEHSVHEGIGGLPPAAGPSPATAPAEHASQPGPLATGPLAGPLGPQAAPAAARSVQPAQATQPSQPTQPTLGALAPGGQPQVQFDAVPQAAFASVPTSPAGPAAASVPGDPLAEAPDAVWYVRPPTGGQFGPATADVMRNWIGEGRVSSDSYVWREGWRDWQEAAGVFPQLGDHDALGLGNLGAATSPTTAAGVAMPTARRSRSKAANAAIIVALLLAVVVLFGVFLYVAFGGKDEKTTPSDGAGKSPVSLLLPGPAATPSGRSHAPSV